MLVRGGLESDEEGVDREEKGREEDRERKEEGHRESEENLEGEREVDVNNLNRDRELNILNWKLRQVDRQQRERQTFRAIELDKYMNREDK
jgi:hypothetical protein